VGDAALSLISKLISGKIVNSFIDLLMVLLFVMCIGIVWVKSLGKTKNVSKETKVSIVFLGALTIVDTLYMNIIKKYNLLKYK
jgi:hypothetical protein